jgi:hypothetical protein
VSENFGGTKIGDYNSKFWRHKKLAIITQNFGGTKNWRL